MAWYSQGGENGTERWQCAVIHEKDLHNALKLIAAIWLVTSDIWEIWLQPYKHVAVYKADSSN